MNSSAPPAIRSRIIAQAGAVFLREGFRRVLMSDLARDLGMSKKTLYAHFDTKESLLRAVLERRVAAVDAGLRRIVGSPRPFPDKLRELTQFVRARVGEIGPSFVEDIRRYAPGCFQIVQDFRARALPRYFGRLMDEGARGGHLRPGVPRELLVRLLVDTIQDIMRPEVLAELRLSPAAAMDQILTMIFAGVLAPRARRRIFPS